MSSPTPSSSSTPPVPSPLTSFPTYHPQLLTALSSATKLASSLPPDVDFHRSLDRRFARTVDSCAGRLLALAEELLRYSSASASDEKDGKDGKGKAREVLLRDREDVEDRFGAVVDVTDSLLERADTALDEMMGRVSKPLVEVKEPARRRETARPKQLITPSGKLAPEILNARIPKPQLLFPHPPNNYPPAHWHPQLRSKPHALVPLGWKAEGEDAVLLEGRKTAHPYALEIVRSQPPQGALAPAVPREPKGFGETPFAWVDTTEKLSEMLEQLRTAKEIAIDLEHHDYRSYWGIVCLMQVSTREGDWVVDTLALREELEVLNDVFADPSIVKVLHGAHMDIIWLQRDLNLYIVNLFDTYHASRTLSFPAFSLAFLLEFYCNYKADKRFQLADWRIRPLPQEMLDYARSDTHFLLYVYDQIRNDLLQRADGRPELVQKVFDLSKDVALQFWEPERYDAHGEGPNGFNRLATKWNKHFFGAKEAAYRAIHAWRDRIAREEDESLRYVLPNHQLFALAEQCPRDGKGVLKCLQGTFSLSQSKVDELVELIRSTLDLEKDKERERREKAVEVEMKSLQIDNATAKGDPSNRFALLRSAEDEVMEVAGEELPVSLPSVDIWGTAGDSIAASSSSLFGTALLTSNHTIPTIVAHSSSLFGNALPSSSSEQDARFKATIEQVHSSLFLAPTVIPLTETKSAPEIVTAAATAEVPFVPKSARQTKEAQDDRNTIVVVGQKGNKKRKRELQLDDIVAASTSAAPAAETAGPDDLAEDQFPKTSAEDGAFDYSALPNLLDDDPATLGKKKSKKQRKNKSKASFQSSDFKKPPKPRTEPKTGNRSMTFK
ncbi:hypothetical protein CALVIDRAFT_563610 [Calocera viscosa TUFC12733]|uniref:HRDC domain-containing protein n=1 Tax=Calocera viscosa (strain TUFC12733) TaxID=1330018 RepID=A0A167MR54_CALVF|nr:hypothetical protein CALVIDRAFT_563610 [Calocera viscosa TUFC12733]